jgi:hypothetical protein
VWTALVVLVLCVTRVSTVTSMVVTVCLVDGTLMVVLLALTWWRLREDEQLVVATADRTA